MIKLVLLAFVFFFTPSVKAEGFSLLVGGVSYHFKDRMAGKDWNNTNQLLGLEYRFNEDVSIGVSRFKNSYFHYSNMVVVQYTPFNLGSFYFGGLVGAVDGYPDWTVDVETKQVITKGLRKTETTYSNYQEFNVNKVRAMGGLTAEYRGELGSIQVTFLPGAGAKGSPAINLGFKVQL